MANLVRFLPVEAATVRRRLGEQADWSVSEYLLAGAVDALAGANWQRAGKRSNPKPKPVPRPRPSEWTKATTTVAENQVGARILDFMARREAELAAMAEREGGEEGGSEGH